MNDSSCSIVGSAEDRRGVADEVDPELARDLRLVRRGAEAHQPFLEALCLERPGEQFLDDEHDPMASFAEDRADPRAVVGRTVGALREEDDRAGVVHRGEAYDAARAGAALPSPDARSWPPTQPFGPSGTGPRCLLARCSLDGRPALAGWSDPSALAGGETMLTVFVDPQRCIGCLQCEYACAVEHSHSRDPVIALSELPVPRKRVHVQAGPTPNTAFPNKCRHCDPAPCQQVCPTGAIYRDAAYDAVLIDASKCIACAMCAMVCPFDVHHLSPARRRPRPQDGRRQVRRLHRPAARRPDPGLRRGLQGRRVAVRGRERIRRRRAAT